MAPELVEAAVDAYVAAWNTTDDGERSALLNAALADHATFTGPTGTLRGREDLAGLIVALRSRVGDAAVRRTGPLSAAEKGYRFGWQIARPDGSVLLAGEDEVAAEPDGRLCAICVVL